MEHAIAENDRTARETPGKNCRASERFFVFSSDPSLLSALLGVWYYFIDAGIALQGQVAQVSKVGSELA